MIAPLAALLLTSADPHAACMDSPAERWCRLRKQAHDHQEFDAMFELVDREVEEVRRHLPAHDAGVRVGALRPLCLPLEAAFNVCNERRPERGCAEVYLERYAATGCLADPAQRPRFQYMRGLYHRSRMDYAGALRHLREAELEASVLWLSRWDEPVGRSALVTLTSSTATRAEIAAQLRAGEALTRTLDAVAFLLTLIGAEAPHVVADLQNQLGWALLLAREADLTADDPTALLAATLEHFTDARPDRDKADNARINLGLAALQRGALVEARAWVGEVEEPALGDEGRMWLRIIQIRTALAAGDPRPVEGWLADLDALATRGTVAMADWFAAWMRGLHAEVAQQPEDAIAAYESAEAILEAFAHAQDGALGVLADRRYFSFMTPTRRLVRLLLEAGAVDRAAWVVRHVRSRALRIAARESCSEAQFVGDRPRDGLRLSYFRLSPARAGTAAERWVGFAATSQETRAAFIELERSPGAALGEATLPWLSERLLEPFRTDIEAASALEILATGELHAVPFHALPWDGGLLVDHATVRYGLDLGTCGDEPDTAAGRALVIGGEEPWFAPEMDAVVRALRTSGFPADVLRPGAGFDVAPLLSGRYARIHIAAHGARTNDRVLFSADDRVQFAADSLLSRRSVLAVVDPPAFVFLAACQSSFADAETLGGGLSLAHAFLLRGARFVVGSVGDIDGEVARRFAERFYTELGDGPIADVPAAWQAAYRATHDAIPPSLQPKLRLLRLYSR